MEVLNHKQSSDDESNRLTINLNKKSSSQLRSEIKVETFLQYYNNEEEALIIK